MQRAVSTSIAAAYTGTWVTMDTSGNVFVDTTTVDSGIFSVSYIYDGVTIYTNDFTLEVKCAAYTANATIPALTGVYNLNQMLNSIVANTVSRPYATEIQPLLKGDTCSYCSSKKVWTLKKLSSSAGVITEADYSDT